MSDQQDKDIHEEKSTFKNGVILKRLKALGIVGFLFFLGKGIVWLFVLYYAGKGCA